MESCVTAYDLHKRIGDREILHGVSLDVARGSAFGLLGPNGAGKTTTVRLLAGVLTPTSGSVALFDTPLTQANAGGLRARVGVQTDTALYETLTLRDNLRTWADLYDVPRGEVASRIDDVTQLLGLGDRLSSRVGEFSKGMRQKVAVARAVLHRPELLFLDEPTAGLDPEAAQDLISYLRDLLSSGDTTLFLCTHQLHGLETLCQDLGFIEQGRLVDAGPIPELMRRRWPASRYRLRATGDAGTIRKLLPTDAMSKGPCQWGFDLPAGLQVSDFVARLVAAGVAIEALVPLEPSVQDLYFATITDAEEASR